MSEIDIVTFRLDKRLFGLEARRVQDVFHPRGLTGVPLAASEIIGVLNLRGRIVTAVCARKRLGLADRPAGAPEPRAIGVELGGDSYGIVVDSVEGVVKLEAGDLLPPPDKDAFADVCRAGRLLPQKSTYFYPKVTTGLVMRSLDGDVSDL